MTQRISVTAQTHTTSVFYGHIPDELIGDELITRTQVKKVTFQRYTSSQALVGTGTVESPIDSAEVPLDAEEYLLYDTLQTGLPNSTAGDPYTFIWRVPESREPFFTEPGRYIVTIKFYLQDGTIEKLTYEVNVT